MGRPLVVADILPYYKRWAKDHGGINFGQLRHDVADFLNAEGWAERPVVHDIGFWRAVNTLVDIVRSETAGKGAQTRRRKRANIRQYDDAREQRLRQGTLFQRQ